jgi:DNA polymerase III epsilon subunit-like protein
MNFDPITHFPPCLQRLIVVDLETSSLSPAEGGILQIGAVPLDPARADEFFTRDVRHEWWMPWEAGAAKVHGLDKATAADHRRYTDTVALEELLDWIDDTALGDLSGRMILAGMSPRFDYAFLRETAVRNNMEARFDGLVSHRTVDMHTLACAYVAPLLGDSVSPYGPKGLDGLATDHIYAALNLPPEAKPHTALEGARREADAIRRLFHLLSNPNPGES